MSRAHPHHLTCEHGVRTLLQPSKRPMHEIGRRCSGRPVARRTLTTRPCGEPSGGWPSGSRSSAQRSSREPASVASERRPLHGGTATIATLRSQARRWAAPRETPPAYKHPPERRRQVPLAATVRAVPARAPFAQAEACVACTGCRMRGASAAAAPPATRQRVETRLRCPRAHQLEQSWRARKRPALPQQRADRASAWAMRGS
jgi:hypothetical protein